MSGEDFVGKKVYGYYTVSIRKTEQATTVRYKAGNEEIASVVEKWFAVISCMHVL